MNLWWGSLLGGFFLLREGERANMQLVRREGLPSPSTLPVWNTVRCGTTNPFLILRQEKYVADKKNL